MTVSRKAAISLMRCSIENAARRRNSRHSPMFQATNSSTPASTASGTLAGERRGDQHDHQQRRGMDDAGDRAGRPGAQVGDGAGDRPGRRNAAEERRDDVGDALRHQLLVRIVALHASTCRRRPGRRAATRPRRAGRASPSARTGAARLAQSKSGQTNAGKRLRDAAEAVADRLHRQVGERGQQRERDQGDDRPRHPGGEADRAPRPRRGQHGTLVPGHAFLHRQARERRHPRPEQQADERGQAEAEGVGIEAGRCACGSPAPGRRSRPAPG